MGDAHDIDADVRNELQRDLRFEADRTVLTDFQVTVSAVSIDRVSRRISW
jgi:hypothetical protein